MGRDELDRLGREELVELILCQRSELAEREARLAEQRRVIAEREARVGELGERVRELEDEVARLSLPPKTPENSSVPPSRGQKADPAESRRGAKRGPKRGHVGVSRARREPDVVLHCRPIACDGCGAALTVSEQRRVGRSQVTDLPPVRPMVVEAWRYAATCAACGARAEAPYPVGLEPRRRFGPQLEALLGYLREAHHLGYERLETVCRDVFGLRISQGAIAGLLRRLAERARPAYEAIGTQVRGSPVINSDETGARVDGRTQWHWVFQTPTASYHLIAPSRGGAVIDGFLDGAEPEVWGSDLWAPQVGTAAGAHQVCMSHQVRDLTYAVEADGPEGRRWARDLRHVFGRAMRLHHERGAVSLATFARRRVLIAKATDRLVFGPPLANGEARRLQKRYQQHRDSLYVFLERDDVEPTNNSSEQDLRNSVIHRKVTGGYRSGWGAAASAICTSILTTARKRGENLFAALRSLAGPSPLQAAGIRP
jgi:transposase